MARSLWVHISGRPAVEIELVSVAGRRGTRTLLADTGAGSSRSHFDVVLSEADCHAFGKRPLQGVKLGGAYDGWFSVYLIRVAIPSVGFDGKMRAVGVPTPPKGFDGIAGFRFLNRFTYGNFGDPLQFGLEL
jgi:hypothetical protein